MRAVKSAHRIQFVVKAVVNSLRQAVRKGRSFVRGFVEIYRVIRNIAAIVVGCVRRRSGAFKACVKILRPVHRGNRFVQAFVTISRAIHNTAVHVLGVVLRGSVVWRGVVFVRGRGVGHVAQTVRSQDKAVCMVFVSAALFGRCACLRIIGSLARIFKKIERIAARVTALVRQKRVAVKGVASVLWVLCWRVRAVWRLSKTTNIAAKSVKNVVFSFNRALGGFVCARKTGRSA